MKRLPLNSIHAIADERPAGYVAELLSAGKLVGDFVEFDDAVFDALTAKFSPSLPARGMSVARAFLAWAVEGFPIVSDQVYFERESICVPCPFYRRTRTRHHCALCTCDQVKLHLATEQCPDKPPRWIRAIPAAPPP